jgi:hypothetical protein
LAGLLGTAFAVTLILQPAAPTSAAAPGPDLSGAVDRVQAELADPPDLSRAPQLPAAAPVVFHAPHATTGAGIDASVPVPGIITCLLTVFDPHVALQPTKVQATTRVSCSSPLPVMVAGVALYRQGQNSALSSNVATGFLTNSTQASTFTPCQTSGYVALGTATVFAPPGFSPPVAHATVVSNVVLLAATGTGLPPLTCERPPQPTPKPPTNPPTPGPVPDINSLFCEYAGSNRYSCNLNATGWTQIRWTYNGSPISVWNNKPHPPIGNCGGGTPTIKVYVSNSNGTSTAQRRFRCEGQPL